MSESKRNEAGVGASPKGKRDLPVHPALRPHLCKWCAEPLETITEQTDGICAPCLKDGDEEASVYGKDE